MSDIYERKAEYWTQDLADRNFEQQMMAGFFQLGWEFQDNTAAHDRPDLYLFRRVRGRRTRLALELKEKRQQYRPRWAELAKLPEPALLIVDEVAVRKLLAWAPRAGLLFHDLTAEATPNPDETRARQDPSATKSPPGAQASNWLGPYVLFTIIDLFCAPKVRARRPIARNARQMKAKWLLDRRHGLILPDLSAVYAALANFMDRGLMRDLRGLDAHGVCFGEELATL